MPTPYRTTISVAPETIDLTVLDTVKEELDIEDNDSDRLLSRMISEQSEVAAAYCRRPLAQATIIDNFNWGYAYSNEPLRVSRFPLVSISEVIEGGTSLVTGDYEYDAEAGFIWRLNTSGYRSTWAAATTAVTYVGGYELLTTLPRDIEKAVLILIKESWYARARDPRARSESVDGIGRTDLWVGTIPGGGALPAEATALLEPYRRYAC